MSRVVFGLLGVVLALFPERSLAAYEGFAIENPDECDRKAWIVPAVRAEGLVFALCSLTGERAYARLLNLVGAAGAIALLFPRQYLDFGANLGYEQPGAVEWTDRFVTAVRGLGALSLILALRAAKKA